MLDEDIVPVVSLLSLGEGLLETSRDLSAPNIIIKRLPWYKKTISNNLLLKH